MNSIGDARIDLLQRALDGLSQRQQAIAGNIANVDTPGYQRRDVDFESSLRASLGQQGSGAAGSLVPGGGLLQMSSGAVAGRSSSGRNDGNNVDIDYEMSELAETSLRYDMLTQATAQRFAMLKDIITK